MKAVITGANGFLGSHIVRYLSRKKINTISLIRENSNINFIKNYDTKIIKINYEDDSKLTEALMQVDILIHNAAVAKDWGSYNEFEKVNVNLTEKLIRLAHKAGIKDIILISSNSVIGEEDEKMAKDESSPYNPRINYFLESIFSSGMNHYKITKAIGEKRAIEFAKNNNLNLTVLRPVWIFGPREFNAGPFEYCKTILSGVPAMPGSSRNLFHTVYVEDVAKSVFCATQKKLKGINIYMIGPKKVIKMQEFYSLFCKNLKIKKPINIPKFLLWPFVTLMDFIYLILNCKNPPLLTRARLYMFFANNVYKVDKAEKELGFIADTNIEHAIKKTIKWWKLNKYL